MKVSIRSNKGFSLVELMVVVAIIGILAAIAIPNFQRFTAKSKQAEAKADLSAIYTAERAFQSEWQTFEPVFDVIGYAPSGNYRYQHGFAGIAAIAVPTYTGADTGMTGPVDTAGCSQNAAPPGPYTLGCNVVWTTGLAPTEPGGAAVATGTFTAVAGGIISGTAGLQDQWTVNETKTFVNVASGLP